MTSPEPQKEDDIVTTTQATFATNRVDLPSLLKQIRVSRSTLGAVLDELESADRTPAALEALSEGAMIVATEIERLWDIAKRSG
jgi:hypothetical protein